MNCTEAAMNACAEPEGRFGLSDGRRNRCKRQYDEAPSDHANVALRQRSKPAQKKEQGTQALLEKLCRPYFPAKFRFDLAGGTTLLVARQGSSRDLDHQVRAPSPSLWAFS
jgi:hypothetical protein